EDVLEKVELTGSRLRSRGCRFGVSLEDSSRTPAEDLSRVIDVAAGAGAEYLTVCDTAGDATPDGARRLVRFVLDRIAGTGKRMAITWHGHNDRGLGLANALAAAEAGAAVISGTFLGIGERCGNTALEQVIAYLHAHGATGYRVDTLWRI